MARFRARDGRERGEAASQTLANRAAVDAAASVPIPRRLIAMDKQEIAEQAGHTSDAACLAAEEAIDV